MQNKNQSQNKAILEHLESGETITAIEALNKFGCFRLAARIKNLRDSGCVINTVYVVENGKSFAQYNLTKEKARS